MGVAQSGHGEPLLAPLPGILAVLEDDRPHDDGYDDDHRQDAQDHCQDWRGGL